MKDAEEGANEAEASSAVFNGFGSEDIAGDKHMWGGVIQSVSKVTEMGLMSSG